MQSITNASEDTLVDALSFKLPGTGSYVSERKNVTYHPEGSGSYSASSGTKVVKFRLSSDGWMDPSTFRIMFNVVNDNQVLNANQEHTKFLRPIGDVYSFFRRLRISIRGIMIEDIQDFNRVSHMFSIFQSKGSRQNEQVEGFGYDRPINQLNTDALLGGISTFQTVVFKPLSGFLNQSKFLPLKYCPMEFELELVSDSNEPIISLPTAQFTAINTSYKWRLENFMVKVDVCVLDSAMDGKYTDHLGSGKTIPIVYDTYISSLQTIVSADSQINVSRSLTKLKTVFVTLDKNFIGARATYFNKSYNTFYSPMTGNNYSEVTDHNQEQELQSFQLQIGSMLLPQYPVSSHAEAFYMLKKSLGYHVNDIHSIDLDGASYRNNKFIIGVDTERLLGVSFSGTNTKNALMTVKLRTTDTNKADRINIVLVAQQVVEIGSVGIDVFD